MGMIQRIEELVLNQLIHNDEYFKKVFPHLKKEYFLERSESLIFECIKDYGIEYSRSPSIDAVSLLINNKDGINNDEILEINEYISELLIESSKTNKIEFVINETETFCQEKALYNAILDSMDIINGDETKKNKNIIPELMKEALKISFNNDIGLEYDRADERYDRIHRNEKKIPFDIEALNIITKGGIEPKTLNVVLASVGVGKTLFLCHCTSAAISQGKNVLYITMEMSEENISNRIDANLMNIDLDDLDDIKKETFLEKFKNIVGGNGFLSKLFKLKKKNKLGKLFIKSFPTGVGNSNHFRYLLDDLALKKDFIPDMIVIDYLNICSSVKVLPSAGLYGYVKSIAEEVRSIAIEYDVPILSATQTNRGGFDNSDLSMTDTSESIALPATTDLYVALSTNEELEKSGRMSVKQLKNRYRNVNNNVYFTIGVDKPKMRLYHIDDWNKNINNNNLNNDSNEQNKIEDNEFVNYQTSKKIKDKNRFDGINV